LRTTAHFIITSEITSNSTGSDRRLGKPCSRSGCCGEDKNQLLLPRIESQLQLIERVS
jgi:hypothetical protein